MNKKEDSNRKLNLDKSQENEEGEEENEDEDEEEEAAGDREEEEPVEEEQQEEESEEGEKEDEDSKEINKNEPQRETQLNTQPAERKEEEKLEKIAEQYLVTDPRSMRNEKEKIQKKNLSPSLQSHTLPKYFLTEPATTRNSEGKTVFTKVSEELFHKFMQNKDQHNQKKPSAYDFLVNDMFLNRVCEKEDKESESKFKDFVQRNEEFKKQKTLKLQERTAKIAEEINTICSGMPNGKVIEKGERRTPAEYLRDHEKYYENRDMYIAQIKENKLKTTNSEMRSVPEISKKSKKLAIAKRGENSEKTVHERLQKEKIKQQKARLVKEKKEKVNQPPVKTMQDIKQLVDKLHNEAETFKKNKEEAGKDKNLMKEMYKVYDSNDELISKSTQKVLLDKFVRHYEKALSDLFSKRNSILITQEEFSNLMHRLGCTKYEHNMEPEHGIENLPADSQKAMNPQPIQAAYLGKDKKMSANVSKELSLLKNAWSILFNQKTNEEAGDRIDTNQLLVFCLTFLGVYKGEEEVVHAPLESLDQGKDDKSTEDGKKISEDESGEQGKNKDKPEGNTTEKPQGNIEMKGKIEKDQTKPQNKVNFLKINLPELDYKKYYYLKSSAKKNKILFKYFYENIILFWADEAKRKKEEKKLKVIRSNSFPKKQKHLDKMKQSAECFRNRIYKEIETEMNVESESNNQNPSHTLEPKSKKLKNEQVYLFLKKKKENEIKKQKQLKEEKEMKNCTFQPNIFKGVAKNVRGSIENLYIQGKAKQIQKKKSEEKKSVAIDPGQCTFKPKINGFDAQVFDVNPLLHDERMKKEMERFEQARILKKITEIQKKKGIMNLKQYKNFHTLIKEEDLPGMKFGIEKTAFKETFDNFEKKERGSKGNLTRSEFGKTAQAKTTSGNEPLLNIEVNIDDNNRIVKLEIYPGDDPVKISEIFCQKHGLSDDKKLRLQKIIEEKVAEANANLGRH